MIEKMSKPKAKKNNYKKCKYCGGRNHSSIMCFRKARKPLRQESISHKIKRTATAKAWFVLNPPDKDGYWECYLHISPRCLSRVNIENIQLEHVYPKGKYKELRYRHENLKPSCSFCNDLKRSNTINALVKSGMFPMLEKMVCSQEWKKWEVQMAQLASEYQIRLESPLE